MHESQIFTLILFFVGALSWASKSLPLCKTWWVFLAMLVLSNIASTRVESPWIVLANAMIDLIAVSLITATLKGAGYKNTLFCINSLIALMVTGHVIWSYALYKTQIGDPFINTSTRYYYQWYLNALTLLSYLVIGVRCVVYIWSHYDQRNRDLASGLLHSHGGRK